MNVRYWVRHPLRFVRRVWHFAYERLHPEEPFLAPAAVRFLDAALPRDGVGLEWGSGRSTRWLAQRLGRLVTVEHDPAWREEVSRQLEQSKLDNVDYRLIPLEHPVHEPTRPIYDPMPRYVSFVEEFPDEHFDFIEVDGHYRQACVVAGAPKLKPGGLLLVDDTNWLPLEEWGVPETWHLVHQSVKINTTTSIWKRPRGSGTTTP
jgi:predicted O-methyltransferase YrrM